MYDRICPGKPWLDTKGNRIQAHAGSVMYLDGLYYWYGENKEKTTGENGIWHWGVRCYTSKDLYNWEDQMCIRDRLLRHADEEWNSQAGILCLQNAASGGG